LKVSNRINIKVKTANNTQKRRLVQEKKEKEERIINDKK
jgi:hypothetical protein